MTIKQLEKKLLKLRDLHDQVKDEFCTLKTAKEYRKLRDSLMSELDASMALMCESGIMSGVYRRTPNHFVAFDFSEVFKNGGYVFEATRDDVTCGPFKASRTRAKDA